MSNEVLHPTFSKLDAMATSLSRRKTWGGQTPSREMPSLITQRRFSAILWRFWD